MTPRLPKILPAAVMIGLVLALTAGFTPAQQPLPPLPPPGAAQPAQPDPNAGDPNQPEVLARGPVHEAFAATVEAPVAGPIVAKQPPDPIEELPPDEKPSGDNVQWIPGYWSWDDDADRYIWISGFWRVSPPGRIWVPGSWREVRGGYQWAPGFWQEPPPQQVQQAVQQQPEIQYLPPPPASIEVGPTTPAITATSFYTPGSWVWRGRFLWRPGFWIEHRPNWVWVPAHYRWSPVGYVFIDGYWDYPLANRGVLYAPMYFPQAVYAQPAFVYTPAYVVSDQAMMGAMFIRRGYGSYYFGDYYAPRYATGGFTAWCGTIGAGGGFSIGFGVGRAWGYDPLWSYYSFSNRANPAWSAGVTNLYGGRYNGTIARPPVNLVQQNVVINKITNVTNVTNVTNNVTVVNKHVTVNNHNVTDVAMLAPAKLAKDLHPEAKIQPISAEVRKSEAVQANLTRDVGIQRRKVETAAVAQRPILKPTDPPAKAIDQPQTLKLDVPKAVVAKAHVIDETKPPPANPHKDPKAALKVDPNINHQPDPHPVFTPKVDPKVNPKIELNPKIDPKVNPKIDPKIDPKVGPKVDPNPKVDPLPKVNPKVDPPKVDPLPKVNPKVDPLPKVNPKVDPPKVDPLPKVEPKVPVVPKVEPKVPVVPKVEPKGEPKFEPKQPPKVEPKFSLNVPPAEVNQPIRVQPLATIPNPMVPVQPVGTLPHGNLPMVNNPVGQLPHGNLPMVNHPQAPQPRHGAPASTPHKKD